MQTLYIRLKVIQDWVELRYWQGSALYETQRLRLSEIQSLVNYCNLYFYTSEPELQQVGRKLFAWLDGNGRWLSRAINQSTSQGLVLAIASEAKLAHLPWEVLHNGTNFLVEQVSPPVVPVRWVEPPIIVPPPQSRELRVLFMATAPEGSKPPLEFEREEAEILQITDDLPLTLRVEESGCIDELGKLWRRYDPNTFDVFHLIGHASIQHTDPYNPYFITETLTGEQHQTTPMDLVQAFVEKGFPKLIFLSGCRTAQSGDGGEVSSMAEVLVRQGVPAVLGWGQAVIDGGARVASSHFYERLAAGCSIAHALGSTYRQMRKQKLRDWDRLRLYTHDQAWGCLVSSPGFTPPPLERVRDWFLDPETKKTRVATPGEFVGRRRLLQNCLRQLFYRDYMGVLLHGLGGVGKSTVAARLLERLPEYTPIVIDSGLDQQNLTGLLEAQCTSVIGLPILESFLPLRQKLLKFLNPHSAL